MRCKYLKKKVLIQAEKYNIELISNGVEYFDKIVLCFHGFNGDKWGDAYSGLKNSVKNSLVCSFDSCGHGSSEISSEDMRLDLILEEINVVVNFFRQSEPSKPIILVAVSYGAYRVMQYLIKYKPNIDKVIYINPAFKILNIIEKVKEFNYSELKENAKVVMKRSLNKFIKKAFLDDLHYNDLYAETYDISYKTQIVVGKRDSLIPIEDTLEIASRYYYDITYIDEEHCFKNKESWQVIVKMIEEL